jgi:hypothetical protein
MNIQQKVDYNMSCSYIVDKHERNRYVNNRQMLFNLYDNLYEYFEVQNDYE